MESAEPPSKLTQLHFFLHVHPAVAGLTGEASFLEISHPLKMVSTLTSCC